MTDPMAVRLSAPAPVARTSGTAPRIVEITVITIGRSRSTAASTTASRTLAPESRNWLANSTIRMPFLAIRPINRMMPIWL